MLASDTHPGYGGLAIGQLAVRSVWLVILSLAMSHGYRPASSQKCLASDTHPGYGALAIGRLAVRSAG